MPTAEEYRLKTQGLKQDRISSVYRSLEGILPSYLKALDELPHPFKIRIHVIFDRKSTRRPQGSSYQNYLSKAFYGKDCRISSKRIGPDIISVEIEKSFESKESNLKQFLFPLFKPRAFQFSDACSIIIVGKDGEPIPNLSLFYTDGLHHKYLPKLRGASIYPNKKTPYMGRSTIFESLTYYSGSEKELITRLLLQIIDIGLNPSLRRTLNSECRGRLIAHEKVLPPGKEIRLHWRIKRVGSGYEMAEYHPGIFERMIVNDDAFAFYPSVKQRVEFDGKELNVQTRLVVEVDPHTSSIAHAAEVFDTLTEVTKRLGLPIRRFHSGSDSARIHTEIDAEDLLEGTPYLLEKYSFIGSGMRKRCGDVETDYMAVLGALKDVIFVNTWNYLYEQHPPRITKNKFNYGYDLVLIDFPTDSIAAGSPKKIVRLDTKTRRILEEANQDNPNWSRWSDLPFTINVCTPLRDDEKTPRSNEEILALCNALFAAEKFEEDFPLLNRRMKEKITTEHVDTVLRRVPEEQFIDLHVLSEENFRMKYR